MRVGFTGTRHGMTRTQQAAVYSRLATWQPAVLVHGACIGADDEADLIAVKLGIARMVFPSDLTETRVPDEVLRARGGTLVIAPPAPPLERNRHIVDNCQILVACPRQLREVLRSGTWATVRYARRINRRLELIVP